MDSEEKIRQRGKIMDRDWKYWIARGNIEQIRKIWDRDVKY